MLYNRQSGKSLLLFIKKIPPSGNRRYLQAERSPLRGTLYAHQRARKARNPQRLRPNQRRVRAEAEHHDRRGKSEDQGGEGVMLNSLFDLIEK